MSITELPLLKPRATTRVADFAAFVGDKETEAVLRRFVSEQALPHFYIALGGVDEAIEYLGKVERSPLFLMVDLHGSAMPLSDLGRLSQVCEPSVQVVGLGERNDVGLYRSLLKLGISDYLVKPLTVELMMRTINVADGKVSEVASQRSGKVITFAGTRGGVGVSTIAVNLARHLADKTHRRVAYVDLDLNGGSANSMLGLKSNNGLNDLLQNVHRLDPQYVERTLVAKSSKLFVLSAETEYRDRKAYNPGSLKQVIQQLSDSFHYVFLDASDPADIMVEEAYDLASRVYLITDRTVHCTRQAVRLLRHIEDRDNNPPTSILVNTGHAVTAGRVAAPDYAAAIGRPILYELPFEPKILAIAENLGEEPKGKDSAGFPHAIRQIANDLTGQREDTGTSVLRRLRLRRA